MRHRFRWSGYKDKTKKYQLKAGASILYWRRATTVIMEDAREKITIIVYLTSQIIV